MSSHSNPLGSEVCQSNRSTIPMRKIFHHNMLSRNVTDETTWAAIQMLKSRHHAE